jgi:radical SAM protein
MTCSLDFDLTPLTVIWEVTRACDLCCVHCRAEAQPGRDPDELTTAEGFRLLEEVCALQSPVFVITGGDPLKRADLFDLIAYGVKLGLAIAVTPSGTSLLTRQAVSQLRELGVRMMAVSLDGATPELHDGFRQQLGSYDWTVSGIHYAQECRLPVQINTTVTKHNLHDLSNLAALVHDLGAAMWSVFFLVTVGRGKTQKQLDTQDFEDVFHFLYDLSRQAPFGVRTTAAPHYRRVVLQRQAVERKEGARPTALPHLAGLLTDLPRAPQGVTDGNGIVFISHTGEVYPSGFLPLSGGNVRRRSLAAIYRSSPLFRQIRDSSQLKGKCGVCEFKNICGGSRARAYAVTGDFMAEEPYCAYQPGTKNDAVARMGIASP